MSTHQSNTNIWSTKLRMHMSNCDGQIEVVDWIPAPFGIEGKSIIIERGGGGRVPEIKGWKGVSWSSIYNKVNKMWLVISWNRQWWVKNSIDRLGIKKKGMSSDHLLSELSTNPVRTLRSITILLSTIKSVVHVRLVKYIVILSDSHLCLSHSRLLVECSTNAESKYLAKLVVLN